MTDNKKELVSIIVPAYNVEKYINKCLESIRNQNYSNIDVIVVDDGSTDKSGEIADHISNEDNRIRVFHRQNSGVSASRNFGIEKSIGEYVVFVDADDYIAEDYVSYMLENLIKTNADMVVSDKYYVSIKEKQNEFDELEILNSEKAVAYFLSPDVIVYSPNNMIRKSILVENKLYFRTDIFYGEGLTFTVNLAKLCDVVCMCHRKVYYYRRNNDSSATTRFNYEKILNGEKAINALENQVNMSDELISLMFILHKCNYCAGAISKLILNKKKREYYSDYVRWKKYIKNNIWKLLKSNKISLYRKFGILGMYLCPVLTSYSYKLKRNSISNNSFGA